MAQVRGQVRQFCLHVVSLRIPSLQRTHRKAMPQVVKTWRVAPIIEYLEAKT